MHLRRGIASSSHGTHHERGADDRITSHKDVRGEGRQGRFEKTHGQQYHVGLYHLRLADRLHEGTAALGIGFPRHFLYFHARHFAVLAEETQGVKVPTAEAALLMARSGLEGAGPEGPGILRVVGTDGRLRHDFDLRHAAASLAVGRAYAVAPGVAAADDEDVLPLGGDPFGGGYVGAGKHPVLLGQHVEGEVDAFQLAAGDGEVTCLGRAGGDDVGIEAGGQMLQVDIGVELELNVFGTQDGHTAVDEGFVQLEVGDTVAQEAAGILVTVEHGDSIARLVQAVGGHQPGGAAANDTYTQAVAPGLSDAHVVFLEGVLGDGGLVLAVGGGFVLHEVEYAGFLAESWADAPGELGEVVGGVEQAVGQLPVAPVEGVVPLRRAVAQGAGPMAERHAAVHAARSLQAAVAGVKGLFHFAEVVYAVVHGAVSRLLASYGQKCFRISHNDN